jgi:hypothetical protein
MDREGRSPFKILPQALTISEVFTRILFLSFGSSVPATVAYGEDCCPDLVVSNTSVAPAGVLRIDCGYYS